MKKCFLGTGINVWHDASNQMPGNVTLVIIAGLQDGKLTPLRYELNGMNWSCVSVIRLLPGTVPAQEIHNVVPAEREN